MIIINRIDLKEEEYLKYYPIYNGYESKIYKLSDDTLLKVFKERVNPENKLKKIEILSQIDIKENIFKDLVYVDNKFIGFSMENLNKKGYKMLDCCSHFSNEKIKIAKLVWQRLKELYDLGIIYGDIREPNILYNGNDIIFCDIDNVMIDKYWFDLINKYEEHYLYKTGFNYELLKNYMFNIFFYGYYQKVYMPLTYAYLKSYDLEKRINNESCKQIAYDMTHLNKNYDGKLFIDNLNDTFTTKIKRTLHR